MTTGLKIGQVRVENTGHPRAASFFAENSLVMGKHKQILGKFFPQTYAAERLTQQALWIGQAERNSMSIGF